MRRPRIHLSTAIVLMLTASGMLWLNLTPWEKKWTAEEYEARQITYGCPRPWHFRVVPVDPVHSGNAGHEPHVDMQNMILNGVACGLTLVLIAVGMERLMRRRKDKNES